MQAVTASSFHLHKARILGSGMDSLPDEFEVIVVGTGLVESMVAAAAARNGHTVLHLDTASYYGGDWAAFTWDGLQDWLRGQREEDKTDIGNIELGDKEHLLKFGKNKTVLNIEEKWHVQGNDSMKADESNEEDNSNGELKENFNDHKTDAPCKENAKELSNDPLITGDQIKWTKSEIESHSRKFNLDLTPRLLFSRGPMVELLISSNISRYTEFKSVTRVLTLLQGKLEQVPSSRSDVFNTKHISVVEKRILMKFLTHCLSVEMDDESEGNKPFLDFLKLNNLTPNLVHFIVHAIAMVDPSCSVSTGLASTKKFLSSLGRFGPTPFLWSMYGTGELPQAFCRLCAVFGGVYYLGRELGGMVTSGDKATHISVKGGKKVSCEHVVLPNSKVPQSLQLDSDTTTTSRGMFLSSRSVLVTEKEQLTFISLPHSHHPIHVVEVSAGTAACPKGLHVLHASTRDLDVDLRQEISQLVGDSLVYSITFHMVGGGGVTTGLTNVHSSPGPMPELDFDMAIEQAQKIYNNMFTGEEFLPRAPDPEEIILGGEDQSDDVQEESKGELGSGGDGNKEKDNDEVTEDTNSC